MTKQPQRKRISPILDDEIRRSECKTPQSSAPVFNTKEEYIIYLAEKHLIELDTRHSEKDGYLRINGVLPIDEQCNPYWDWSDVIATSATISKGAVRRYQHLPKTYKGITISKEDKNLKPLTIESYMLHNKFGVQRDENGFYHVDTLRIPSTLQNLDFSSIKAKVTLFFGDNSMPLSKLPYSELILGMSIGRLELDCDNPYEVAKEKGCGAKILKALEPKKKGILSGFAGYIGSIVGFTGARR